MPEVEESFDADWVVVGSGFGGSVAALRLAEKGYRVVVLEQGRRFGPDDFPRSAWNVRRLLWMPRLGLRGIMQLTRFRHVTVLSGVGVGGGSLVYANTLYQPHSDDFYRHPQWADLADWRIELAPHFATARRMLGVVEYDGRGPSDELMEKLAVDLDVPGGAQPTPVAVFFGEPGVRVGDPFFGGDGPDRVGCTRCGQCMLGCRVGAKNTLDQNYLWLADRHGAEIRPGHAVRHLEPLGTSDGAEGYAVTVAVAGRLRKVRLTARGVVLAGGALGTNRLLRRSKDDGSLAHVSDRLGTMVRTNSEAIPAATADAREADYRSDIAITASIFVDEHTHLTNNTYGVGGDALALTFGPLTAGRSVWRRRLQFVRRLPRHLWRTRLRGWSRRTVIFTVMQSSETSLRLRRTWWGRLQTEPDEAHPIEAYLPLANQVAELAAAHLGGHPQSSVWESLAGAPTTAHFLGGAAIGASAEHGVVDRHHRVFGYDNLLVCDGSVVPANVGVNPSLTITAMAEAAMAHVPAKTGQADPVRRLPTSPRR